MLTTFDYSRCSLKLKRPEEASGHGSGDGNGAPVLSTEAFRILKIHPGKQDSDIVCNLTVHKLLNAQNTAFPDPPRYDALSYTWGPQHGDKRVRILESNNIHDLPVGPNLDSALRQFRHATDFVHLWVSSRTYLFWVWRVDAFTSNSGRCPLHQSTRQRREERTDSSNATDIQPCRVRPGMAWSGRR